MLITCWQFFVKKEEKRNDRKRNSNVVRKMDRPVSSISEPITRVFPHDIIRLWRGMNHAST